MSPQLRKLARPDKDIEAFGDVDTIANERRIAQLRQLLGDVFALRLLCQRAQVGRHPHRCLCKTRIGRELQSPTLFSKRCQLHPHRNTPLGSLASHEPFEDHIVVSIECHAGSQALGHAQGIEAVACGTVYAEAG